MQERLTYNENIQEITTDCADHPFGCQNTNVLLEKYKNINVTYFTKKICHCSCQKGQLVSRNVFN